MTEENTNNGEIIPIGELREQKEMKDLLEMANSQTLELENDREEIRDRIEFADNEDFNSDTYDKILESINVLLDKKWPADFYLLFRFIRPKRT